jgi:crotonobetainyl-CoA:carnitine CoA-transferase CaiB-like acyl-CoA transferase
MSVLKKIRVIEFAEGVPGPLAALRLSDLGADVIKVECKEGDWLRNAAPALPGSEMSAAFFELNRGKRSVVLNEQLNLAALLKDADVFITDRTTEQLNALGVAGIDAEPYAENRNLVRVCISFWGDRGPLRLNKGSELAAQAMAGYTRYLGSRDAPACRLGADVACAGTGIFAVQATLATLLARVKTGVGQRVTLSLLNSLLALKSIHLAAQSDPDVYAGPRVGGANYPPERGWKTRDEQIFFAFGGSVGAEGRPGWVKFCEEAGFNRLLEDERFDKIGRDSSGYGIRVQELRAEYEREFSRYSAEELVALIRKHAGNAASYQRADHALDHAQTKALGIVRDVAAGGGATVRVRAFPARFSNMQTELKGTAPRLGEHTQAVSADIRSW